MDTDSASLDQVIEELRQNWDRLSPLDRARSVAHIKTFDISNRQIAKHIQHSESAIRNLLLPLQAPPADLAAARQGKISNNKLLRRPKDADQQREKKNAEERQLDNKRKVVQASKKICEWLVQERVSGPDVERIIEDVRREFAMREQDGSLPDHNFPKLPLEELIRKCRPKRTHEGNTDSEAGTTSGSSDGPSTPSPTRESVTVRLNSR